MAYRYTYDPIYLQYAEGAAEYYLKNSGKDLVPLWDYDAVSPQAFKVRFFPMCFPLLLLVLNPISYSLVPDHCGVTTM